VSKSRGRRRVKSRGADHGVLQGPAFKRKDFKCLVAGEGGVVKCFAFPAAPK